MLGAGPAGLAAALRLRALGHAVTLVERQLFPRAQVGEALTAGVPELLCYLDAEPVLASSRHGFAAIPTLDAVRVWEGPDPEHISAAQRGSGIVVDRGSFDLALLELARVRGVGIVQPAKARRVGASLELEGERWTPRVVVDARGRAAPGPRVATGVTTIGVWVDDPVATCAQTRIEATPLGWLWGTPLPGGGLRTLAFIDPELARRGPRLALAALTEQSRLFKTPPAELRIEICDATARVAIADDPAWWIRAGDAAHCLDPLSSSGVERAMRSGLQAAIAAHTLLAGGSPDLITEFVRTRVVEAVARHSRWSQEHYQSAYVDGDFWRKRARPWHPDPRHPSPLLREIAVELAHPPTPAPASMTLSPSSLARLWAAPMRVSPQVRVVSLACVVNDQIRAHPAVVHPRLERPVAFIGGHAAVPLLDEVASTLSMRLLVLAWSRRMPSAEAARVAAWMLGRGLIEVAPDDCSLSSA